MGSLATFQRELRRTIEGEVRFDSATRALYSTDASNYRRVPIGVIVPRHEGDVIEAVALARENSMPILARGGGTALAGQSCNAALVLDFSKYMNAITRIDPQARHATVQPGVVQSQLNAALAPEGLFFGPDPSTKDRCTLGGMIGNNSCGAHSAAYGKTVDNIAALDVLLYDGTRLALGSDSESAIGTNGRACELYGSLRGLRDRIGELVRNRYPKIPRRVSGYNLDQLLPENGFDLARAIVGSEGTLAITLRATVMLARRPKHIALAVLGFDDVFIAADQTPWILEHHPEALEGFDHRLIDFGKARGIESTRLLPEGLAFLIVEVAGDTADEARGRAEDVVAQAHRSRECGGAAVLTDSREQQALWRLRESGLGAGAYVPGYPRTWPGAEDCAVAPGKLGAFLRRFKDLLGQHQLAAATYYGHFGEGCVHSRVNFDFMSAAGISTFRAAMFEIADLVVEFGGSLSGEHGDGLARSELLPKMFGAELMSAFGDFKRIFDPDGRMNPGVIVDPDPLDSHLRIPSARRARPITSHFDLSADGGLDGALIKCIGIGKCRKTAAGTMCPSYMATREELHSTRGRAHLLWEALNGDLLQGGPADHAVRDALELCLSCKACKSECPASVDMAKYKAEFLAHYFRTHRRRLGDRFFSRIHELARLGAVAPRLANALTQGPAGTIVRRMLNVHRDRALPRLARQPFRSWWAAHRDANPSAREVVLFADTFTNLFEPDVAIAAVEVIERAGFSVTVPARDLCCGRPLYDQGMLERAKWRLEQAIETLGPYAQRGAPIIGLEPSCVLTFRDELPALFPNDAGAKTIADRAMLFDEFLAREAPALNELALDAKALVHGHCHQKAIAGLDHELAILQKIGGLRLTVLDAGCCGMAGAFGYARDRYEVSRAIGERVLLPAIRASAPGTVVIADGFSCRSQIRQFCPSARPMHLAQVLRLAMGER